MTNDWHGSRTNSGESAPNGNGMALGMALGRLEAKMDDLPHRIAQLLEKYLSKSAPAARTTDWPKTLGAGTELLKALLPVIIVIGAIFNRIRLPNLPEIIKSALWGM